MDFWRSHSILFRGMTKCSTKERMKQLEKRVDRIEKGMFPNTGRLSKVKGWVKLRKKGDPFDPSQYKYKPTPEELKNLERIMLEES